MKSTFLMFLTHTWGWNRIRWQGITYRFAKMRKVRTKIPFKLKAGVTWRTGVSVRHTIKKTHAHTNDAACRVSISWDSTYQICFRYFKKVHEVPWADDWLLFFFKGGEDLMREAASLCGGISGSRMSGLCCFELHTKVLAKVSHYVQNVFTTDMPRASHFILHSPVTSIKEKHFAITSPCYYSFVSLFPSSVYFKHPISFLSSSWASAHLIKTYIFKLFFKRQTLFPKKKKYPHVTENCILNEHDQIEHTCFFSWFVWKLLHNCKWNTLFITLSFFLGLFPVLRHLCNKIFKKDILCHF